MDTDAWFVSNAALDRRLPAITRGIDVSKTSERAFQPVRRSGGPAWFCPWSGIRHSSQGFPMPARRQSADPTPRNLALEYVQLDDLSLDPNNARLHSPAQIKQIARSIEAFAFNVPILADREGKVLAGHGRLMACRQLGWTEVPVIRLDHLTPEQ